MTACLVLTSALAPRVARAAIECTPELQWDWDGEVRAPEHPQSCISPLVVQLTDDDGNGFVDADDIPDVAFIHQKVIPGSGLEGRITAVDGLSGTKHFTATFDPGLMPTALAAADLDGDGVVELLAIERGGERVVAFDNDGAFLWTSDPGEAGFIYLDTITVADLDQDGSPEIIVGASVFGADGRLRWEGEEGRGVQFLGSVSHAVDLAPASPGLELLAGHTLYSAAGDVLWRNGAVGDGWTAVADFDGDGDPEIAHVSIESVHLLDERGNQLTPLYTFGATPASQPVAADLDGDGDAELFLMQAEEVRALDLVAGSWVDLWSQSTEDPTRINGASAFDFDGDGTLDLVYHDMVSWYIFDGPTGEVLHQEPFPSVTGIETPVLADIDNDCRTEILLSACAGNFGPPHRNGVRAYECSPAARARPLWNQYAYHVTNVLDDGSVPRLEQPAWLDHNTWMGQVSTAVEAIASAAASQPPQACAGESVPLDGSPSTGCSGGYEYRYSSGTTPACSWSPDPVCEVAPTSSPSRYTLHVRCTGEPCEDRAEIVVELDPNPRADAGPPESLCTGSSTRVGGSPTGSGGSGAHSYLWESSPPGGIAPGEENLPNPNTVALTEPAVFTVTVTDAAGCSDTDTVEVDVFTPATPQAVGPTLRVQKDPVARDVLLLWSTADPEAEAFRIRRGWPPASSYPVHGPDAAPSMRADSGVLDDGRSHAYLVSGVNCAGIEGP